MSIASRSSVHRLPAVCPTPPGPRSIACRSSGRRLWVFRPRALAFEYNINHLVIKQHTKKRQRLLLQQQNTNYYFQKNETSEGDDAVQRGGVGRTNKHCRAAPPSPPAATQTCSYVSSAATLKLHNCTISGRTHTTLSLPHTHKCTISGHTHTCTGSVICLGVKCFVCAVCGSCTCTLV